MDAPPWTYDQSQRYQVLRELIHSVFSDTRVRLLDVGGVSPDLQGRELWLPARIIHEGPSVVLDLRFCPAPGFIQGEACRLPFPDRSFDIVSALDVIEHIEPGQRDAFLSEICRVSRGLVLISAPFRSTAIEGVEKLLLNQMKRMWREIQQQLLEHETHGLPEIQAVRSRLSSHLRSVQGFEFGSLPTWFLLQTLKNTYQRKRNAWIIHGELERWAASRPRTEEFDSPASHYFWLGSKIHTQNELDTHLDDLKDRLASNIEKPPTFEDTTRLHKEIVEYHCRAGVSALILSSGRLDHLKLCLDHVLTQNIDFDLEVCVWSLDSERSVATFLNQHYPAVSLISPAGPESATTALFKTAFSLSGEYILFLNEDIVIPTDTLQKFYDTRVEGDPPSLLSPRIIDPDNRNQVVSGGSNPLKKPLAPRFPRMFRAVPGADFDWIYSECLFFHRSALFAKKPVRKAAARRRLFLWEKQRNPQVWIYRHEFFVHKQR